MFQLITRPFTVCPLTHFWITWCWSESPPANTIFSITLINGQQKLVFENQFSLNNKVHKKKQANLSWSTGFKSAGVFDRVIAFSRPGSQQTFGIFNSSHDVR